MNMTKLLGQKCNKGKEVRFLESPAGFYLGTLTEEGFPNCRFSSYFESMEEFESCTFRDCMEVQHCNQGFGCFGYGKIEIALDTDGDKSDEIIDFCKNCGSAIKESNVVKDDHELATCSSCGRAQYVVSFEEVSEIVTDLFKKATLGISSIGVITNSQLMKNIVRSVAEEVIADRVKEIAAEIEPTEPHWNEEDGWTL